MIQHPYRPDLNGTDLSGFRDPTGQDGSSWKWCASSKSGARLRRLHVAVDGRSGRIVPKISYVREFKPWGWIIGTGIYIEDIRAEIAGIKRRLLLVLLLISAVMALLLTFIVRQNLRREMKTDRGRTRPAGVAGEIQGSGRGLDRRDLDDPGGATFTPIKNCRNCWTGTMRTGSYRCCSMRDATFTLWGLHALDLDFGKPNDFMSMLADLPRKDGTLQIMYGIDDERNLRGARFATSRATTARARYARATVPTTSARTTSSARCSTRFTSTPSATTTSTTGSGRCCATRWRAPRGCGESRTRASGRRAGAPALRLLEADVLGGAGSRRPAGRVARSPSSRCAGRRAPTRSGPTSSRTESTTAACSVQHYARRFARRLQPAGPDRPLPAAERRARPGDGAARSPTSSTTTGWCCATASSRPTTASAGRREPLICSFSMVSALSEIGERERARALCERLLSLASPLGLLRRGARRREAGDASATSPRPSPTSR